MSGAPRRNPQQAPVAKEHRINVLVLDFEGAPALMYQAQCSCSWNSDETFNRAHAEREGREHVRVRAEKARVHPWLDVK